MISSEDANDPPLERAKHSDAASNVFDIIDMHAIKEIYKRLDLKSMILFSGCCKRFMCLRDEIKCIVATKYMNDSQLKLFKNVEYLDCHTNGFLTDDGLRHLPLKVLKCGDNTRISWDGLKHMKALTTVCIERNLMMNFYPDLFNLDLGIHFIY